MHADRLEQLRKPDDKMQICSFLWVYYGFPNSCYEGRNVEEVRFTSGLKMGEQDDCDADCVCGIRIRVSGRHWVMQKGKAFLIIVLLPSILLPGPVVLLRASRNYVLWWQR